MKRGKKIKNKILGFLFGRFSDRMDKKIAKIQNQPLKVAANQTLDLSELYAEKLTDTNPNNSEQIKQLLIDERQRHIDTGESILLAVVSQVKDQQIQTDLKELLKLFKEMLEEGTKEEAQPAA